MFLNRSTTMPEYAATITEFERHEQDLEQARLDIIMAKYEATAPRYEIAKVGDAGYVVKLGSVEPVKGNDWVLYDLDDTLIAYSEAKQLRLDYYQGYLQTLGLDISRADADSIMNMTDKAARWPEQGVETYHVDTHAAALDWCTDQLLGFGDVKDALAALPERLQTARDNGVIADHVTSLPTEIFGTMLQPPVYEDTLQSMRALADSSHDDHDMARANLGVFTLGEVPFQLIKVLNLLEAQAAAGKPLPISHIWLTTVSKGDFLDQLAGLADDGGFVQEDVFDQAPHSLLLLDDSGDQLESFAQRRLSGVTLSTLHALRPNIKNAKQSLHEAFDGWHATHSGNLTTYIYDRLRRSLDSLLASDDATVRPLKPRLAKRQDYYKQSAA